MEMTIYNESKSFSGGRFKNPAYSFATYGEFQTDAISPLMELVTNAIDAVSDESVTTKKIFIDIDKNMLRIQDTGIGLNEDALRKAFAYAVSSHKHFNNNAGTGIKTALSFFNPNNDKWSIVSRVDNKSFCRVAAPFGADMDYKNFDYSEWRFGDEVKTVVEVAIDNEIHEDLRNELSLETTMTTKKGIVIFFNGAPIAPVFPSENCTKMEPVVKYIDGIKNVFTVENYLLDKERDYDDDDDSDIKFNSWKACQENQGVYIFVNGRFVSRVGTECIKSLGSKTRFCALKTHPSMNRLVSFVHIETYSAKPSERLPLTPDKRHVKWNYGLGTEYREILNDLLGDWYREYKNIDKRNSEATFRKITEKILKRVVSKKEVHLNEVWIDSSHDYRVDYVVWNCSSTKEKNHLEGSFENYESCATLNKKLVSDKVITHLIEFKKNKVLRYRDVTNLFLYAMRFNERYGYIPENLIIIGGKLSESANDVINAAAASGIKIQFVGYSEVLTSKDLGEID